MEQKILDTLANSMSTNRPDIKIGDTVKLHLRIKEGNKERIQVFAGLVIAMKGTSINRTVTVRKISGGVGVERIVPLYSPLLEKVEVVKRGQVRKSKIYFMRDRIGKKALRVSKLKDIYLTDEVAVPQEVVEDVVPVDDTSVQESTESVESK